MIIIIGFDIKMSPGLQAYMCFLPPCWTVGGAGGPILSPSEQENMDPGMYRIKDDQCVLYTVCGPQVYKKNLGGLMKHGYMPIMTNCTTHRSFKRPNPDGTEGTILFLRMVAQKSELFNTHFSLLQFIIQFRLFPYLPLRIHTENHFSNKISFLVLLSF